MKIDFFFMRDLELLTNMKISKRKHWDNNTNKLRIRCKMLRSLTICVYFIYLIHRKVYSISHKRRNTKNQVYICFIPSSEKLRWEMSYHFKKIIISQSTSKRAFCWQTPNISSWRHFTVYSQISGVSRLFHPCNFWSTGAKSFVSETSTSRSLMC